MPLSTSVSSSLEISLTFLPPAGRWPPGPPCCSSAGGGPSSGFQPVLGGTPQAVPPAVTSANTQTDASRKNLVLRDILHPLCQCPLPDRGCVKALGIYPFCLSPSALRRYRRDELLYGLALALLEAR